MFRLRQASGEEAIFRSVDELALGLRSGIIGAETDVLDGTGQEWHPLSRHPMYPQARAISLTLLSPNPLDFDQGFAPARRSGDHGVVTPVSQPVLQMYSRSAAELQARRRPKELMRYGIIVAAIGMVCATTYMIWLGRHAGADPVAVTGPRSTPTPQAALQQNPNAVAGGYWLSPATLASRREAAREQLDQALTDSVNGIRLRGLLSLPLLQSPDSVRVARQHISDARRLVDRYRVAYRGMLRAYDDSAGAQVRSTRWSPLDANDWKSRRTGGEPASEAIRADSLLGAMEGLYQLLLTQQGTYTLVTDSAQFSAWRVRVEYQRLRGILGRNRTAPRESGAEFSVPLTLLLAGLEGPALPDVPPAAE